MITIQTKKFYYVESKEDYIDVTLEDFPDGPLPLVWNNNGLRGIISIVKIINMLDFLKDAANLPKLEKNSTRKGFVIHWDDRHYLGGDRDSKQVRRTLAIVCSP